MAATERLAQAGLGAPDKSKARNDDIEDDAPGRIRP